MYGIQFMLINSLLKTFILVELPTCLKTDHFSKKIIDNSLLQ